MVGHTLKGIGLTNKPQESRVGAVQTPLSLSHRREWTSRGILFLSKRDTGKNFEGLGVALTIGIRA